ncbi:MAG: hypothetical protein FWH57_03130 [Oscillospiraceae bacterium]|nr:hypothetical protein [Oscillospiraceae bacterium]
MIKELAFSLAISLALTLVLESGFFFLTGKRNKKDLMLVSLVNIITNPVVVLSYWLIVMYADIEPVIVLIPLELFAMIIEGCYYKKYGQSFKRPYFFSIAANVFSFAAGLLFQQLSNIYGV